MFKQRLIRILENSTVIREYLSGRAISGVLPIDKEHRKLLLDERSQPRPFVAVNSDAVRVWQDSDNQGKFVETLSIVIFHPRDHVQSYMVVGEILKLLHPNNFDTRLNYKDDNNSAKVDAIVTIGATMDQWNPIYDCGAHIITLEVLFGYDDI